MKWLYEREDVDKQHFVYYGGNQGGFLRLQPDGIGRRTVHRRIAPHPLPTVIPQET